MGIYYAASAIIGYKVSPIKDRIETQSNTPNCPHDPPSDAQFCPTCGSRVGVRVTYHRTDEWETFREDVLNMGNFKDDLIVRIDFESDSAFWIGIGSSCYTGDEPKKTAFRSATAIKSRIADFLQPWIENGLFNLNDDDFGIWTLMIGN